MPPRQYSRYTLCDGLKDENGNLFLTDPAAFRYRERDDNIPHEVKAGDTLGSLAGHYFKGYPRAAGLWWAIAWYQLDPIHDPTITLEPGRSLVIPSRQVLELIFNENRRGE